MYKFQWRPAQKLTVVGNVRRFDSDGFYKTSSHEEAQEIKKLADILGIKTISEPKKVAPKKEISKEVEVQPAKKEKKSKKSK